MSIKINSSIEAFIKSEITEKVKNERNPIIAKKELVEEKLHALDDKIVALEEGNFDEPRNWSSTKRKIETELRRYFKRIRTDAMKHVKEVLAKNGLTCGKCNSFYGLASDFFEIGSNSIEWIDDVVPAINDISKLDSFEKERLKLKKERDAVYAELEKFDNRIIKATGKVCCQLITGKGIDSVNDLIKNVKI